MLTEWWMRLEAAPGFGGPRRYLNDRLGADMVGVLEGAGVLRHAGISPSYPCEERCGDCCPRVVVEIDGMYHAICGNRPAGCRDLILTEREAALLELEMAGLCRMIASTLCIRASPESIRDLTGVHRVGSVIPEPGTRYPVYFVIRSSAPSYAEVFGALVAHQGGRPFAALVPTGRFLTEDVERQVRTMGVSIVVLSDVMVLAGNRLSCCVDPVALFSSLGQRAPAVVGVGETVAQALICTGDSQPRWQDLDEPAYRALVAEASSFNVFADEQTKIVHKGPSGAQSTNMATASQFESIRLAVRKRGYFDPLEDDPQSRGSAQQIFQRARKLFDPRLGPGPWRLFKTIEGPKGSLYHFSPDRGVSFAFIFLPEP